jgi:hypothetical protein
MLLFFVNGDAFQLLQFFKTTFFYEIIGLCSPFQFFNKLTDFHEILYGHYNIRGHRNLITYILIPETSNNYLRDTRTCERT